MIKKLIEDLKEYAHLSEGDSVDTIKVAMKIVEEQPEVGKWIPCNERFPNLRRVDMESEGEYYMISDSVIITDGERISISEYEIDDGDRGGWLACECEEIEDVIAWQPLPEPYRPDPVLTTKWYRGQKEENVCYRK